MIRGTYKATQGMIYEALRIDIISNNLANADSTAYKTSRLQVTSSFDTHFNDFLRNYLETKPPVGPYESPELMIARYETSFAQGTIKETGNDLDVAIVGPGFFGIENLDGSTVYSRDGTFKIDGKGNIVNQHNLKVLDADGQPLVLPKGTKRLQILPSGQIYADGVESASLIIVDFQQPYPLSKLGASLFEVNDPNAKPIQLDRRNIEVVQGFLEESNVNLVNEMVQMIETLRNFEGYQRTIRAFDDTVQQINNAARA